MLESSLYSGPKFYRTYLEISTTRAIWYNIKYEKVFEMAWIGAGACCGGDCGAEPAVDIRLYAGVWV